ncbi:Z1 domain-containing protein [Pseudomonas inefficax]|uniref:Z1 domain-containing protein n=1 Tax=Pseudomonas inefficax TaxID=2078786 RepID=UPI002DBC206D|nr:Z1 domain-containing protein [Pseudomonas sp. CMAA1741]MEC4562689.1 Z1 domain-containing protein [Pseudomonas sp. CMAA1741]
MSFYPRLRDTRNDDEPLQRCIESVVNQLETATTPNKPGMLLGKIQSGKTRAFLGIIARSFDKAFDITIVLTKGTKTLAKQTVKRIGRDFKEFIDNDEMILFDIMSAPEPLTRSELKRKIIIVAKKQAQNLTRIQEFFDTKYPELKKRRVLLVDDEADMASIRFSKIKGTKKVEQGTIATQMDQLRHSIKKISFLQVTATPYALYLQPEDYADTRKSNEVYYPKRPAFTELLPIHDAYIGGDDYFGGHGPDNPRNYLYVEVSTKEQDALRSIDGRVIRDDRIWTSENIKALRLSLMTFILAVSVRRWQQQDLEQQPQKYAMIIHNDTQRAAHKWQWETVNKLKIAFEEAAIANDKRLKSLFEEAYSDLRRSIEANGDRLPSLKEAYANTLTLIKDGEINIQRVNSDVELEPLLDAETAELKLRTKANVFIGGSILDRGITVPNLLAFYYGRNPTRMQADTVLQHSRMYGARPISDIAVTRFYTSSAVYARLNVIHDLETALREAFELDAYEGGVVFIQDDAKGGVTPCAPNKLYLSDTTSVRPNNILLPTNFNTAAGKKLEKLTNEVTKLIPIECTNSQTFSRVPLETAVKIIELTAESLIFDSPVPFNWEAMKGLLTYYCEKFKTDVLILAETGRELDKGRSGDRSGLSILGTEKLRTIVKEPTRCAPALILLQQKGGSTLGWNGGPFWWPMLASPPQAKSCIFAGKSSK